MMKKLFAVTLIMLAATLALGSQGGAWAKFSPTEGHFSVLLPPGAPKEDKETKDSPYGPYTTHLFTAREGNEIFLVGWVDYDPGFKFDVQKELEANRDNFIKGVNGKLLNTSKTSLGTHPGMEFTAESSQAFFRSRVYVVGRRPYQLIAITLKGTESTPNVNKFLTSFEVSPAK